MAQPNQPTPQFQMAQIPLAAFFDNNESKTMLNSMNLRLNDMDLKLSLILELLATRLPDQRCVIFDDVIKYQIDYPFE